MSQRSKRHHFVPRWLLKEFCVGNKLWVGTKGNCEPEERTPDGTFQRRNLNTRVEYLKAIDGTNTRRLSDEHENILGKLDNEAAKKLPELLAWARGRGMSLPVLPFESQLLWKTVILAQARRSPESQDRVGWLVDIKSAFLDVTYERAEELGQPMPPRDELLSDEGVGQLFRELERNIRARFAAADDPQTASDGDAYVAKFGLAVGLVPSPTTELAIGSHGLTLVPTRNGHQSWLPLAPDVAICLFGEPGTLSFGIFNESFVRRHNLAVLSNSKQIAGRSRDLVVDLVCS